MLTLHETSQLSCSNRYHRDDVEVLFWLEKYSICGRNTIQVGHYYRPLPDLYLVQDQYLCQLEQHIFLNYSYSVVHQESSQKLTSSRLVSRMDVTIYNDITFIYVLI